MIAIIIVLITHRVLITFTSSSSSDSEDEILNRKGVREEERENSQIPDNKKGMIVVKVDDMINNASFSSTRYSKSHKSSDTAMVIENDVIEVKIDHEPNDTMPSSSPTSLPTTSNNNNNGNTPVSNPSSKVDRDENTSLCMGLPGGALSNMLDCCCGKESKENENENGENGNTADRNQEWGVHPENNDENETECM